MKKWRIKRKRDWVIAGVFLLLLSYLAASVYRQPVNGLLMGISPEKMSVFNQPEHQGVYGLTILLAAFLYSVLWVWQQSAAGKRVWRVPVCLWIGTGAALLGLLLSYQAECRRIVNTPRDTDRIPWVSVTFWSDGAPAEREAYEAEPGREAQDELLRMCLELEAPPEPEQEVLRERMNDEWDMDIRISYPEYKGHAYTLWFSLKGDVIRLHKGHSAEEDVYYDGAKIRDFLAAYTIS